MFRKQWVSTHTSQRSLHLCADRNYNQTEFMFTGLIEEIGTVSSYTPSGDGAVIVIAGGAVMDDLNIDDSIAVNGCCLTVAQRDETTFTATAVAETLKKTTLGSLATSSTVNLERALRVGDRMGGHYVQGHVDATGTITDIHINTEGCEMWISFPAPFRKWMIPVGSICVNGISLTLAELEQERFKVALIPHTMKATTMHALKIGDSVNLEFDTMAKYAENFYGQHTR